MNRARAQEIVNRIDDVFGIDICVYQNGELILLRDLLIDFLDQRISTNDLIPADARYDKDLYCNDDE